MLNTESKPARKRPILTLRRSNQSPVASPVEIKKAPPAPLAAYATAQSEGAGKVIHEWRQYQEDGAATKRVVDAREVSWIIEGGKGKLAGRAIIGFRDPEEPPIVIDRGFTEFHGWWNEFHAGNHKFLTLLGNKRRMSIPRGSVMARALEEGTEIQPLSKGAKPVPVKQAFAAVNGWLNSKHPKGGK